MNSKEALKELLISYDEKINCERAHYYNIIEKDLDEREKMLEEYDVNSYEEWCEITLKANAKYHKIKELLEILKKKRVELFSLCVSFENNVIDYEEYKNNYLDFSKELLTETEFDLIKEWLRDE